MVDSNSHPHPLQSSGLPPNVSISNWEEGERVFVLGCQHGFIPDALDSKIYLLGSTCNHQEMVRHQVWTNMKVSQNSLHHAIKLCRQYLPGRCVPFRKGLALHSLAGGARGHIRPTHQKKMMQEQNQFFEELTAYVMHILFGSM